MKDSPIIAIVVLLAFSAGIALGKADTNASIRNDCQSMHSFRTQEHIFDCTERKP